MMAAEKRQGVTVAEIAYGVLATVDPIDSRGENIPRSDRYALAMALAWQLQARGKQARVIEEGEDVCTLVHLGEVPDAEYEEAAGLVIGLVREAS